MILPINEIFSSHPGWFSLNGAKKERRLERLLKCTPWQMRLLIHRLHRHIEQFSASHLVFSVGDIQDAFAGCIDDDCLDILWIGLVQLVGNVLKEGPYTFRC